MTIHYPKFLDMHFPPICSSVDDLDFKGILLDAYGVFWGGNSVGLLPGSQTAMQRLVAQGKRVGILSNTTQLAQKELAKFQTHGLTQGVHFHFLITSGDIAKGLFLEEKLPFPTPHKRYLLFGQPHPKFASHEALFAGSAYIEKKQAEKADFLFLSIPHIEGEDQTDPERFRPELEKIVPSNLPMVCVNPDRFAHEGNPARLVVRQGSLAEMYEALGGRVFYVGKPSSLMFAAAQEQFQKYAIPREEILMVGDTPETDIRGARNFGIASALILKTGVAAERIAHEGLEKVLATLSDSPTFLLERLK